MRPVRVAGRWGDKMKRKDSMMNSKVSSLGTTAGNVKVCNKGIMALSTYRRWWPSRRELR